MKGYLADICTDALNNIYSVIHKLYKQKISVIDEQILLLPESEHYNENKKWVNYYDLEINLPLFKKGILVVRPYRSIEVSDDCLDDGSSFYISLRELLFNPKIAPQKTTLLLNKLKEHIEQDSCVKEAECFTIINKNRRDEVFSPLVVTDGQHKAGFYVYPWLSNTTNFEFSGFTRFVTAGCMFGASIKGIEQLYQSFALIKHDIEFHPSQKIVNIEFNPRASNPYEEVIFNEFNKLMLLMKNLSNKTELGQVYYHLPYYDYMLFGIELFIRGRMTLKALNQFFKIIILKKIEYVEKIKAICEYYHMECKIESPFENLFGNVQLERITETILEKLEVPIRELNPELDVEQTKLHERDLVQYCLMRLQTNDINKEHKQVWIDFVSVIGIDKIYNLEGLFKIANATMVALAATGEEDYKTCSVLPVSEKQIQVGYSDFKKSKVNYPTVFNLTTIDPVIGYDPVNDVRKKGLLFYFGSCQDSLSKLVKQDILTLAHKNIALAAENKNGVGVQDIARPKQVIPA